MAPSSGNFRSKIHFQSFNISSDRYFFEFSDGIMNHQYAFLGFQMLSHERKKILCTVFPLSTSCTYPYINDNGNSANTVAHICNLNLNQFNQSFFLFLWCIIWITMFSPLFTLVFWCLLKKYPDQKYTFVSYICNIDPEKRDNLKYICDRMTICKFIKFVNVMYEASYETRKELITDFYEKEKRLAAKNP